MNAATARFSRPGLRIRQVAVPGPQFALEHLARHADGEVIRCQGDVQHGDAGMARVLQHLVGFGQQPCGLGRRSSLVMTTATGTIVLAVAAGDDGAVADGADLTEQHLLHEHRIAGALGGLDGVLRPVHHEVVAVFVGYTRSPVSQ